VMLGMIISVGVMNSMFGDNMQCYVDATNKATSSRRQMVEGMDKIAAQHPSGDGIAAGKLALFNVAQTFGLGPAIKQLPAFRSPAPEGRKLAEAANDNSCMYSMDGACQDGLQDSNGQYTNSWCTCGTDRNDCGYRFDCTASPPPPPYNSGYSSGNSGYTYSKKTDEQRVDEVEKAVLDVFNPAIIIPAIFCALFLYLGSGLALKNPACGGKVVLIIGSIFSFPSFIIYAIGTYFLLIAANIYVEIIKTSFNTAVGTDDHVFTKCLDDSRAMFSSAGVGCLIACIGCLGAFISAICASCGICKHETKQKQAALPVPGTQPGTQMTNIAVATPVIATPV